MPSATLCAISDGLAEEQVCDRHTLAQKGVAYVAKALLQLGSVVDNP
jgi:hypothetical protein